MANRIFSTLTALLILLSLGYLVRAVVADGQKNQVGDVAGTVLVWHSWDEERAAALTQSMRKFEEANPGVRVLLFRLEPAELLSRYIGASANGFGPDLLLGPNEWLPELLAANALLPVDGETEAQVWDWYQPGVESTLRSQGRLYGLAVARRTSALLYNPRLVDLPARTLDELFAQARGGLGVGIGTSFESAFWGIGASGAPLVSADNGLPLEESGLESWLTWLRNAQDNASFVMSSNQTGLRELFLQGDLAYLIDDYEGWRSLSAGEDGFDIGVRLLPEGPGGSASPLLRTEALFFNPVSSDRQQQVARNLGLFLLSREEQTLLMRRARLVPVRRDVRINSRLNPEIAAFAAQANSALPWTADPQLTWLLSAGDDVYLQALEGVLSPANAVAELFARMQEATGRP